MRIRIHFSGSSYEILEGLAFTSRHIPLGKGAPNAAWAALSEVARFLSEEMAGQASQFYSLKTGGHYKICYGSETGIKQLHFSINNWIMGEGNEPVVTSVVLPLMKDGLEFCFEVKVAPGWEMQITNGIGLAPLLESPRRHQRYDVNLLDVLRFGNVDCTFHVCWQKDKHDSFLVSGQEPDFKFFEDRFEKGPHRKRTLELVRSFLG